MNKKGRTLSNQISIKSLAADSRLVDPLMGVSKNTLVGPSLKLATPPPLPHPKG